VTRRSHYRWSSAPTKLRRPSTRGQRRGLRRREPTRRWRRHTQRPKLGATRVVSSQRRRLRTRWHEPRRKQPRCRRRLRLRLHASSPRPVDVQRRSSSDCRRSPDPKRYLVLDLALDWLILQEFRADRRAPGEDHVTPSTSFDIARSAGAGAANRLSVTGVCVHTPPLNYKKAAPCHFPREDFGEERLDG